MPGMGNLQSVYEQNAKRIKESRTAQTKTPDWMTIYQKSLTPQATGGMPSSSYTPPPVRGNNNSIFSMLEPTSMGSNRIHGSENGLAVPGQAAGQFRMGSDQSSGKVAALKFWEDQNQAFNKANEDSLIDRQGMLGELADFKAQSVMNNQVIEKTLSDSAETLRRSSTEILDRVRNNFASMGRSASPYVMAGISAKLALQNKDKLNLQRSQLEMDRATIHGTYLDKLNQTLADTKRSVMDPQTVMAMMKELGGGNAGNGGGGGGGGTITSGGGSNRNSTGKATQSLNSLATSLPDGTYKDIYANQRGSGSKYVNTDASLRPRSFNYNQDDTSKFAGN